MFQISVAIDAACFLLFFVTAQALLLYSFALIIDSSEINELDPELWFLRDILISMGLIQGSD